MILYNEENQPMNSDDIRNFKHEVINNLKNIESPNEQDLAKELGDLFVQSNQNHFPKLGMKSELTTLTGEKHFSIPGIGKKILQEIKKIVCAVLHAGSTAGDIFDAVVEALASIIPGGGLIMRILKPLIEKIVKYIMSQGIGRFCGWEPNN